MDGFRFDLASALCRDPKGEPMAVPPLIEEIAKDPVLSKVALPFQCQKPNMSSCTQPLHVPADGKYPRSSSSDMLCVPWR